MTFAGLLDTFKGFFSRAFWFSRFLPVLLIAAAHALLAHQVYGWQPFGAGTDEASGGFGAILAAILKGDAGEALLSFAALVILAYALGPAIPMIGSFLDGSLLPAWLHERLREDRREGWVANTKARHQANKRHSERETSLERWQEALIIARAQGTATATKADEPAKAYRTSIANAEMTIAALAGQPEPERAKIDEAGDALKTALGARSAGLRHNPASTDQANPSKFDDYWSKRLDAAHERLAKLLERRLNEADLDPKTAAWLKDWQEALTKARTQGLAMTTTSTLISPDDAAQIELVEETTEKLTEQLEPNEDEINAAGEALKIALGASSASLRHDPASDDPANPSKDDGDWSVRLDAAQDRFVTLLERLLNEAAHQQRAALERLGAADPSDLQPTRFGDARFALARYAMHAYGAPLDYLWPRVRMSIAADTTVDSNTAARAMSDSSAQSDFAVALFALWWTVPLLWLPLAAVAQPPAPTVVAMLGLAAPIVGRGLYELAVQAEIANIDAIASALDQHRRSALRTLGLEPPRTLSGERELWRKLERSNKPNNQIELVYAPAPASTQ